MKRFCWYLVPVASVIVVMMVLASCAGKEQVKEVKLQPFSQESEKKSREIASAFADGFAAAVKSGNFSSWQRNLPPHVAAKVTPELFKSMRNELEETLGTLESHTFLGILENGNLRDNIWKLRFVKENRVCEVLYLVRVYCDKKGEPEISGFGIKRF